MMLKLLKYEMKSYSRIMLPLYLGMFGVALFVGLMFRNFDSLKESSIITAISLIAVISIIAANLMTCSIISILRFRNNLFGPEAYNTLSLPVSIPTHIIVKIIGAVIWTILTMLFTVGAIFIVSSLTGLLTMKELSEAYNELYVVTYNRNVRAMVVDLIMLFALYLTQSMGSLLMIYAAIAAGHQFTSHPILMSIVSYLVINFAFQAVSTALLILGFWGFDLMFSSILNMWPMLVLSMMQAIICFLLTYVIMRYKPSLE